MRRTPLVLLAALPVLGALACRGIVGITDLTVDSGAEGGGEDATTDSPFDANHDAGIDSSSFVDSAGTDGAGDSGQDIDAPPGPDCGYEPPFDASAGRLGCIAGCIQGHPVASGDFYIGTGSIQTCICSDSTCGPDCVSFCSPACNGQRLPSCDDCATHALLDEGGACHSMEDTTCMSGCANLATCLASCPAQ